MSPQTTDGNGAKLASASLLATALTTVAQPVCVLDRDGLIRLANPAAAATLGYPDPGELLGRGGHEAVHADRLGAAPHPASECPLLRPRAPPALGIPVVPPAQTAGDGDERLRPVRPPGRLDARGVLCLGAARAARW